MKQNDMLSKSTQQPVTTQDTRENRHTRGEDDSPSVQRRSKSALSVSNMLVDSNRAPQAKHSITVAEPGGYTDPSTGAQAASPAQDLILSYSSVDDHPHLLKDGLEGRYGLGTN
jgi:hypothetical protein